jgi:hypothetical protein
MSSKDIDRILRSTKMSMAMEGFTIDDSLEETGRKILIGELNLKDYIAQVKKEALVLAHEI